MQWYNTIQAALTDNASNHFACYYEPLFELSDLSIQIPLSTYPDGYSLTVWLYDANTGALLDGDFTINFDFVFFSFGGQVYVNIRPNTQDAVCTQPCFVLRFTVRVGNIILWDKFTPRYRYYGCNSCDVVPQVIITNNDGQSVATLCGVTKTESGCNESFIRICGEWPCKDEITGAYYRSAGTLILANVAEIFPHKLCYWINAKVWEEPWAITRTYAQNCKPQKVTQIKRWTLKSRSALPLWKVRDLEEVLTAPIITVDGSQYLLREASAFERLMVCAEHFRMAATLELCQQQQIYGCNEPCEDKAAYFNVPKPLANVLTYYREDGTVAAVRADDKSAEEVLMIYLRSRPGVTGLRKLPDLNPLPCKANVGAVYQITGRGALPSFFYAGAALPGNRVYGLRLGLDNPNLRALCSGSYLPNPCQTPAIGMPVVIDQSCVTPALGVPVVTDVPPVSIPIDPDGGWDVNSADAQLADGRVTFSLSVSNPAFNYPSNQTPHVFGNELIGMIRAAGAPKADRIIYLGDANVKIDKGGLIYFTGAPTSEDRNGATITLTNVQYSL